MLTTLVLVGDPERTKRRRRGLECQIARTTPDAMVAIRARFRQLTRNLPRPAPR